MRKLKIAYLSTGTFRHVGPYLRFFSSRGHDVHWITYTKHEETFGVRHYAALETTADRKRITKWRYFAAVPRIRRILMEIRPDILHGHYITSAGVLCLLSGFRPYVLSVHGTDAVTSVNSVVWRVVLRRVLTRAEGINAVSQQLADLALGLGAEKEKVLVLPQGIDLRLFGYEASTRLPQVVKLICTRVLEQKYGPVTIINACEILKRKSLPFTLTFAAGGPLQPDLQKMVTEKGLDQHISFLGGYSIGELPGILREHQIYLSASHWDGTSNCLLEVMAAGLFPVVSRIESNQALVRENETAFMFECGNAEELAERIIRIVCDYSPGPPAIEANRRVVEDKGDREKNMHALEKWYYEVLRQEARSMRTADE